MKIKEVVDMTQAELVVKERELRQELFNLTMQARIGRIEKPSRLRDVRRDIARVLTVLSQKAVKEVKEPAVKKVATKSAAKEKAAAKA